MTTAVRAAKAASLATTAAISVAHGLPAEHVYTAAKYVLARGLAMVAVAEVFDRSTVMLTMAAIALTSYITAAFSSGASPLTFAEHPSASSSYFCSVHSHIATVTGMMLAQPTRVRVTASHALCVV
jgi:hypothetical protein